MENRLESKELEEVFKNVRSSYRLLFDYQKRVLDLVRYIGNRLEFGEALGVPAFSGASPREGKKGVFDLWSWDWLNMYHYKFNFLPKKAKSKEVYLDVHIISDTGYYLNTSAPKHDAQKTDLGTFADVQSSETRLILYASENEFLWKDIVDVDGFDPSKEEINVITKLGHKVVGRNYPLSEFINNEATNQLIDTFRQYCIDHDVAI